MKRLLAVLLLAPAVSAEPSESDWTRPIQARPAKVPELPQPVPATLSNGMRLSYTALRESPLVSAVIVLPRAGTGDDPAGMEGLAALVAGLVQQGTRGEDGRPALDAVGYERALKGLRSSLKIEAQAEAAVLTLLSVKEDFPRALALVRQALQRPALEERDFERLRGQALAGLQAANGNPKAIADRRLAARVFGPGHPRGRAPSEASVAAVTLEEARRRHAAAYTPAGASIHIVGDLDPERARLEAEQALAGWTAPAAALAAAPRSWERVPLPSERPGADAPGTIDLIDLPGAPQSVIRLGQTAPPRGHADWPAFLVLNAILGGNRSRINDNLREGFNRSDLPEGEVGKSWTYGAHSEYAPFKTGGRFHVDSTVNVDYTAESIREVLHELRRIQEQLPSDEDVSRSVNNRALVALLVARSAKALAENRAGGELAGVEGDALARMLEAVKKVTPADVQRAAKLYLRPDALLVVIVGDAAKIEPRLKAVLPAMPVRVFEADGRPRGQG